MSLIWIPYFSSHSRSPTSVSLRVKETQAWELSGSESEWTSKHFKVDTSSPHPR
jgi:hypothetical protein